MYHLANFSEPDLARQFAGFLRQQAIECELRQFQKDEDWELWVCHEDHLTSARAYLDDFRQNPTQIRYRHSAQTGSPQPISRPTSSQSLGKMTVNFANPVTVMLLVISACVFLLRFTNQGWWIYSELLISNNPSLNLIFQGEIWRLVTPIFLHFGLLHLLFNSLWIYQLGSAIETVESSGKLLKLVVGVAVLSNLSQYLMTGPNFGGLSGVVYGLLGYIWMQSRQARSPYFMGNGLVAFMLGWLVLCFTGLVGNIANFAHLGGLAVGMIWGATTKSPSIR